MFLLRLNPTFESLETKLSLLKERFRYNTTPEQYKAPADLCHCIGHDNYYKARAVDFQQRNPHHRVPEYYLKYADKYLHKFRYATRDRLSYKGQMWLDKVLEELQRLLEKQLQLSPELETDEQKLTDFAFRAHLLAYEKAGIFELSLKDKLVIVSTIHPKDYLSKRGLIQVQKAVFYQMHWYWQFPGMIKRQWEESFNEVSIS